ncbi:MAG: U32 family peptidase [Clostridiales bacterium]|nr:U32 family peptidase [Clostridiales bacterium]
MLELVTYAASSAQLEEVVSCGADAVCLLYRSETSKKTLHAFTRRELTAAVRYCRVRGVRVYASFESLYSDSELRELGDDFVSVASAGVDAVRLGDPGAAIVARNVIPGVLLHASPSFCARTPGGIKLAASLGFSRVALGSGITADDLSALKNTLKAETEVTVLGSGCASVPGRCYLSSFLSGASAARGKCSHPCRDPFGRDRCGYDYPLCANPVSMIDRLDLLESFGVTAALLDTREIRPDLVSGVVGAFYGALHGTSPPQRDTQKKIAAAFGSDDIFGGTPGGDGAYYFAKTPPRPAGRPGKTAAAKMPELQRVPVSFVLQASAGKPIVLSVKDGDGNTASAEGPIADDSRRPDTAERAELRTLLYRTGATPYRCESARLMIREGLNISPGDLADLRDRTLLQLTAIRGNPSVKQTGSFDFGEHPRAPTEQVRFSVELSGKAQLSEELARLGPARVYLPLSDISTSGELLKPFYGTTEICAVMPQAPAAGDAETLRARLSVAYDLGISTALVGDPDSAAIALSEGFRVRGDWGLNICNSLALRAYAGCGFISATVSFDLTADKIFRLSDELETEMLVYGRLPLMVTERCIIKQKSGVCNCSSTPMMLKDRRNALFPVLKDAIGCHNILYDSKKLFPRDLTEFKNLGVHTLRIRFTAENARECADTAAALMNGQLKTPNEGTYGHYFKKERSLLSRLRRGLFQ